MARLVLPSRLELKRPEGSSSEAPLAKVIFTTLLYVSPVHIIPACDHTGTPLHFHSSTTSGSACLMRVWAREGVSPPQSLSSLLLASISREGEPPPFPSFEPRLLFFIVCLFTVVVGGFSPLPTCWKHERQNRTFPWHAKLAGRVTRISPKKLAVRAQPLSP